MTCYGPLVTRAPSSGDGTRAIASYALAIVGDATAVLFYCSLLHPFLDIHKKKSVEHQRATPYVFGLLNSALWFLYALPLVHTHGSTLMLCVNGFGLFILLVCFAMFLYYCDEERRYLLCVLLAAEVFGLVGLGVLVLTLAHTPHHRASLLGIFAVVTAFGMNAIPAADIASMRAANKSVPISLLVSGCSLLNATIWTVYSCLSITKSLIVFIPNVVGVIIQVSLLIVYYHYKKVEAAGNGAQG